MNIDRELLDKLKKSNAIKKNIANSQKDLLTELEKMIPIIENHIKQSDIEKAVNWLLYNDLWIQHESGQLKASTRWRNYTRGSIIMSIDWGTSNIGTEIRYPHPGVVVYDQKHDWVLAAPITSAKIDKETNQPFAIPPFEVLAFKQNKKPDNENEYWFRKHSVIQVDQIQRISKYRILNKNSYRLRENLLNQVDNIILKYFIPGKHSLTETLKEALLEKSKELEVTQAELEKLKSEIERLKNLQK